MGKTKEAPRPELTVPPTREEIRNNVRRMAERARHRQTGPKSDAIALVQEEARRSFRNESRSDDEQDTLDEMLEFLGWSHEGDFLDGVECYRRMELNAEILDDQKFRAGQDARAAEHAKLMKAKSDAWNTFTAAGTALNVFDADSRCILDQRREMLTFVAGNRRWFATGRKP